MKTEARFLLAIFLMLAVLIGTNVLFPPAVPENALPPDSVLMPPAGAAEPSGGTGTARPGGGEAPARPPAVTPSAAPVGAPAVGPAEAAAARTTVTVDGPLYRLTFSNYGARLLSAELPRYQSFRRDGPVDLVPAGVEGYLGHRLVLGRDTIDLEGVPFDIVPADGLHLTEGGGPRTLTFVYHDDDARLDFEISYDFVPDRYQVGVRGSVDGPDRPLLLTDLGAGLAYSEVDSAGETRSMAYVSNHLQNGISSTSLGRGQPGIVDGPLLWAAFRSKFFVMALMAGEADDTEVATQYLGGLLISPSELPGRVRISAAQTVATDGAFAYRLFVGPQDYTRLSSLGQGMDEVNPYGWKFLRPIMRPIVAVIMWILTFLHSRLHIGYGWVLILFGVLMRIVLFPLNQKAMRAQLRNMAVQPLLQEIQTKYKDNPERLQKEMMKLYKEHGFNPLAGCLPMLLPWPVLIALFFVFQNTIELRGVPFLWLPDLSAPDPLYVLPIFMGLSMFAMQWVSLRSLDQPNPQMKMMMWLMPGMMLFIFLRFAAGLNLYYATANIATIPQQIWIANERKKMREKGPIKPTGDSG